MARFRFRLQRVLDHRLGTVEAARKEYLTRLASLREAETAVERLADEKDRAGLERPRSLAEAKAREAYMDRLAGEVATAEAVCAAVAREADEAREVWLGAKREAETMLKLRDRQHALWSLNEGRKAQAELDEWAVTRRAS